MDTKCKKCGHEIDGNSPVCMYCGAVIPDVNLSQETKERLDAEKGDPHSSSDGSSVKALGAVLIILGILADVISMFMINSSDFGSFGTITIAGTVCFLIGIALFSNS